MNNIDSIIATVSEDLKKYDTVGLIDKDAMYRDIILAVKGFGNDSKIFYEDIVSIDNGRGVLPDNFYRLNDIILAHPISYSRENKTASLGNIKQTRYYNLIKELKTSWNECDDCCKEKEARVFKKEIVVENVGRITCNYRRGERVILTKPSIIKYCSSEYRKPEFDCVNQISISKDIITANFEKGDLLIHYSGYPTDEDGNFDFEDTPNGNLESFLEYHLKVRIIERLILQKVQGLENLLQYFENNRRIYKKLASNEMKMKSLQPAQLTNKIVKMNQIYYDKYSLTRR